MWNFLILIVVNIMWGLQFSGAKIATEQLGPIAVTVIPLIISVLMMAPFLAFKKRNSEAGIPAQGRLISSVIAFVILGTVGIVVSQLFLTWGIARSLASNAAVITLTTPATTAVLAFFLLREKMTRLRWFSFALAFAGVIMASGVDWGSVQLLQARYLVGNLLLFLSCWGASFYNTYAKKLLSEFTPYEVTVYSFTVCVLFLLPFFARI
jgi:drug/metabolite transporter (DMT)-like permease